MDIKQESINESQNDKVNDDPLFSINQKDIPVSPNFFDNNDPIGTDSMSTPALDYKNYTNVNQLNHKRIYQPKDNIIFIYLGCFTKVFPIIFIIFGLIFCSPYFFASGFISYFALILGIILLLMGILIMAKGYYKINFIMGQNDITIIKVALIGKKKEFYGPGELEYIELKYNFVPENLNEGIKLMHRYVLNIFKSNQENNIILDLGQNKPIFTMEEIGYFNYIINEHIQNKMIAHN